MKYNDELGKGFLKTFSEGFKMPIIEIYKKVGKMIEIYAKEGKQTVKKDADLLYSYIGSINQYLAECFSVCVVYQDGLKYAKSFKGGILRDANKLLSEKCQGYGSCGSVTLHIHGEIGGYCYGEHFYDCYGYNPWEDYVKSKAFKNRDKVINFVGGFVKAKELSNEKALNYLSNYKNNQNTNEGEVD